MVDRFNLFITNKILLAEANATDNDANTIPDSPAKAPGELGEKMNDLVGYAKYIAFTILLLALIGAAIELAMSRNRGHGFEASGLLKVLVAVAIVSGAASIIGLFV